MPYPLTGTPQSATVAVRLVSAPVEISATRTPAPFRSAARSGTVTVLALTGSAPTVPTTGQLWPRGWKP